MKTSSIGVVLTIIFIGLMGVSAQAASLVNINTADSATLQTLNGIGPSKAQAIIDYRTQHGPFAAIEDIKNVSGIGDVTYANIKDYITVGTESPTQTDTQTTTSNDTATGTGTTSGAASPNTTGNGPVSLSIVGKTTTVAGADIKFTVEASDDALDVTNTDFIWNFGDGATAEGSNVSHTFLYAGKYVVTVSAMAHRKERQARVTVDITTPEIFLIIEGDGTLGVLNQAAQEVEVGGWRLAGGEASFLIPDNTVVLSGETLRFTPAVTGIQNPIGARLLFQSGQIAALAQFNAPEDEAADIVVTKNAPAASPVAKSASKDVAGTSTVATLTASPETPELPWWAYGAGLTVLLGIAAAGAAYVRPQPATAVSKDPADEFEISD